MPIYFVPGNNDIPLGRLDANTFAPSPVARRRFMEHFGQLNQVVPIANHSLVLLDAIGLVEEDHRRYAAEVQFGEWEGVNGGVVEFVKELAESEFNGLSERAC